MGKTKLKYSIILFAMPVLVFGQEAKLASTNSPMVIVSSSEPSRDLASTVSLDDVINKSLKRIVEKTASTKGRVAIMDFPSLESGGQSNLSSYIANKAGNQLINDGRQVVDRATLEKIINEQKLQQNSLMDAATAAKIGKLAGAGVFVVGNYSILTKKFILTIRALSVETGQFIAASEETVLMNSELRSELDELNVSKKGTSIASDGGSSDESDQASQQEIDEATKKAELEFDKEVCSKIKPGISGSQIVGLAVKYGIIEMPDEDVNGVTCEDVTGESGDPCYSAGAWTVRTGMGYMSRSDIARGMKGKSGAIAGGEVTKWFYNGSSRFKELEVCSPDIGQWTESRALLKKVRK